MWIRRIHLDDEILVTVDSTCAISTFGCMFQKRKKSHNPTVEGIIPACVAVNWVVLQLLITVLTVADTLFENDGIHTFRLQRNFVDVALLPLI